MNNVTTKTVKKLLQNELQSNINDLAEFNQLVKAAELNKWQINKRIEKHLPEGSSYYTQYGMHYVKFPSGREHLIGWIGSTLELSIESLRHSDSCHSNGSEDRISKLKDILKPENFKPFVKLFINLQKSISAVHTAMGAIKDSKADSFHNPAYYPLLKMAGISQSIWFDLQDINKGKNS